ncbi:MAG: Tetratricopeptide repeat protein [Crocinitomicaceae bacterium]|jgi:tetratricopeptide (TPR) repeat protein|nr:Tetratricopeptide repeat protein [Crocinitomicaceae bacterium]
MNKLILFLIFGIFSAICFSQDKTLTEIKKWSDANQHQKIIDKYTPKAAGLSAKSLYFLGLAYYMTQDDNHCIKYMDMSIEKDPNDPGPHFIKASTLNFLKQYEAAVAEFLISVRLNPEHSKSYSGLGDAYYALKKTDLALEAYQNAVKKPEPQERAYAMIAQIYWDKKDYEKALPAYQLVKTHASKESSSYLNALFNIGVIEFTKGNYDASESSFLELLKLSPNDYTTFAKLVQLYNRKKNVNQAKIYRDKLYDAHQKDLLKNSRLQDMFCFDQFNWQDKQIQAYERYETGDKTDTYSKHLFYVINPDQTLDCIIQTEYSPVSVELGQMKYLFGRQKEKEHATFGIGFNDTMPDEELRETVIAILEGTIQPSVTSEFKD